MGKDFCCLKNLELEFKIVQDLVFGLNKCYVYVQYFLFQFVDYKFMEIDLLFFYI